MIAAAAWQWSGVLTVTASDVWRHLFQALAEVVVFFGIAEGVAGLGKRLVVDIADRHDVARASGVGRVAGSLTAHADAGKANTFVRGLALLGLSAGGDPEANARRRGGLQKSRRLVSRRLMS